MFLILSIEVVKYYLTLIINKRILKMNKSPLSTLSVDNSNGVSNNIENISGMNILDSKKNLNSPKSPIKTTDYNHQAVSPEKEYQSMNKIQNDLNSNIENVDDERFGTSIPIRQIPLNVLNGEVNFMDFMSKMYKETKDFGGVRLQPHPEWNPLGISREKFKSYSSRLAAYKDVYHGLSNQMIKHPIRQEPQGNRGFYSFLLIEQDDLPFSQFEKIALEEEKKEVAILEARRRRINKMNDSNDNTEDIFENIEQYYTEFEDDYWKRIMHHQPLYGADLSGSLYNQSVNWNLNDLNSILDIVSKDIKGVTSSYLYFGMHRSTFAWHIEDMNLPAINYLHFGAGKQWYVIPEWAHEQFESFCKSKLKDEFKYCKEYLRHKTTLVSPFLLRQQGIPVYSGIQRENEFMVVWPVAYHCGFNTGFNCAEAVNFAFPEWIPFGEKAHFCLCTPDSVRFDMNLFKESYEKVLSGEKTIQDFKQNRKMININGGMNTMEDEPEVSRCSKVSCSREMDEASRCSKVTIKKDTINSSNTNIVSEPVKRKRGRPKKSTIFVEDYSIYQAPESKPTYTDKQYDKQEDAGSDQDNDSDKDDAYEGEDGDGGYDDEDDDYNDFGEDETGNTGDDGDDGDDDKNNDNDFNPKKRKRSSSKDSPRKKKKIPRGEMECSIEDCPRSGNRSVTSLRNTYPLKPDASGKVCDRHYFSDRRHYMRGTDPNTPKKSKKDRPLRGQKEIDDSYQRTRSGNISQRAQSSTLNFNIERSHDSQSQSSLKVYPHALLNEEPENNPNLVVSYSEQVRNSQYNMTKPIICKDETWNAIASGSDPSIYFFPQQHQTPIHSTSGYPQSSYQPQSTQYQGQYQSSQIYPQHTQVYPAHQDLQPSQSQYHVSQQPQHTQSPQYSSQYTTYTQHYPQQYNNSSQYPSQYTTQTQYTTQFPSSNVTSNYQGQYPPQSTHSTTYSHQTSSQYNYTQLPKTNHVQVNQPIYSTTLPTQQGYNSSYSTSYTAPNISSNVSNSNDLHSRTLQSQSTPQFVQKK